LDIHRSALASRFKEGKILAKEAFLVLLVFTLLIIGGCDGTDVITPPDTPPLGRPVLFESFQGWPDDPVEIQSLSIDADTLTVEVTYMGGCAIHAFEIVINGIAESNPPQTGSFLSRDAQDDPCDDLVEDVLLFDLTPLGEQMRVFYGSGVVMIVLDDLSVPYGF